LVQYLLQLRGIGPIARKRDTDLQIRETSDSGHPITVSDPQNPHSAVFRQIAARVWEKVSGADAMGRTPPRIVIE
jgi:ATP-binding protein involved in chromosome partitioning